MSYQDDGGKASEMTLRDYFAAEALVMVGTAQYNETIARKAYEIADAMIEARKK